MELESEEDAETEKLESVEKKKKDKSKARPKNETLVTEVAPEVASSQLITSNYGVASFLLADLLTSNLHTLKLRAPIQKYKRYDADDQGDGFLDLNALARTVRGFEDTSTHHSGEQSYMDCGSSLVIRIDVTIPLGLYTILESDAIQVA